MNEPLVTLTGNVGADPELVSVGESVVANFRIGCTPRQFSKQADDWVDADTQWYSVSAWRRLGENVAASLRKGDPVVVHGRLSATSWTNKAGITVTAFDIEATHIGHDLARGHSSFTRPERPEGAAATSVDEVAAAQELVGAAG